MHSFVVVTAAVAMAACSLSVAANATQLTGRAPKLPVLHQILRSDWLNVKQGCVLNGSTSTPIKAKGDGKTDDTDAIQACFTGLSSNTTLNIGHTVYFPSGNYIVTKTLLLRSVLGGTIVGNGEASTLTWKGESGGNSTLIWSDGISRTRLLGFVLDGTAGCDIGVDHRSVTGPRNLFETRIRHQNQKFLGFGQAVSSFTTYLVLTRQLRRKRPSLRLYRFLLCIWSAHTFNVPLSTLVSCS